MYQCNYNKKRQKGKHLTEQERVLIDFLLKQGWRLKDIADKIGCCAKTISREKKRGMVYGLLNSDLSLKNEYSWLNAQNKYNENKHKKGVGKKVDKIPELKKYIENCIKVHKFSPNATVMRLRNFRSIFPEIISTKTIYNNIRDLVFADITYRDLAYEKKRNRKYSPKNKIIRKSGGKSIEERSDIVSKRTEKGHWEMDTVIFSNKGSHECLLVLTEIKSRYEVILKILDKSSKSVIGALNQLERKHRGKFREKFKTITTDNGSEFMNYNGMETSLFNEKKRTEIYYAHSYCSYERGSNENNNKLIRRHFPKRTDFNKISKKRIKEVQDWMNNYPRELFGGKTSEEVYFDR